MSFVGRDDDVAKLWDVVEERSVLLTGPRRVGKTELLVHLEQNPRTGWHVVRVDLQGVTSVPEAVEAILATLEASNLGRGAWETMLESVDEIEAAGFKVHRKVTDGGKHGWGTLEVSLRRACHLLVDTRLLLCLDEVPWWLDDVRRTSGPEESRRALAKLRAIRQHPDLAERLRMVLTGSVGLSGLAHELGASADINDLVPAIDLRPLGAAAGRALFESEVSARGGRPESEATRHAHDLAGGFPHWIKLLAERVNLDGVVSTETVDAAAASMLAVRNRALFNDEGSEHFDRRYDRERQRRMFAVLEVAAHEPRGATLDALLSASLGAGATNRKQALQDVMELVDAWILDGDEQRGFRFLLPLFRLWWLKYGGTP